MRTIRLLIMALLALVLILVALANRGPVTVSLVPQELAAYLGGSYSVTLPLFLLLFLTLAIGMVLGLVGEWLRESPYRSQAAKARSAERVVTVQREVAPRDEVLAILDATRAPAPPAAPAVVTTTTTTLPAAAPVAPGSVAVRP
ncbi:DUF1049 domain-containing protein [Paracoccus sp. Z118]|uniref:DUF1049 domain-containing protein n=1 Tax=Paracoccus sp. Z118 TaxID=2851017 RepID=UPI001C2CAB24|nr:DUF1049 domain-containing protein [Paracoccus sp. Z118]MBV0891774.1 DUF1049 domain-containing protein [Paracoccus sp. Z118]